MRMGEITHNERKHRMIFESILTRLSDFLFKRRMNRAIKRNNGRSVCMHCLIPMVWNNYQEREIQITPPHRIMLFCPECDTRAKHDETGDGYWIEQAFRRWYFILSGLGTGPYKYEYCLGNVLEHYGWLPEVPLLKPDHVLDWEDKGDSCEVKPNDLPKE